MEPVAKLSREASVEAMPAQLEEFLGRVADAVNEAPPGRVIAGSEEQVHDLFADFRQQAYELAVPMRVEAAEAAFPPPLDPKTGQRQRRGQQCRPLPRAKAGADQQDKEFKLVTSYSEDQEHRHVAVTRKDHAVAGRGMRRDAGRIRLAQADDGLLHDVAKREEMICYPEYQAKGWQIGSGPTKAMCQTPTTRLKGSGMRWDGDNAEAVKALDALEQSGTWKAY